MSLLGDIGNFFFGGGSPTSPVPADQTMNNGSSGFVPDNQVGNTTTNNQSYAGNNSAPLLGGNSYATPGQVQGVSTRSGGGTSGTPGNSNVQIPQPNQDAQKAIDDLYNSTIGNINNQQGELQTANQNTVNNLNASQTAGQNQINQYGQQQQDTIDTNRQAQSRNQSSALEQLRQLFSDLGRQGQSQASAGGYSSSSANDAMQAILGRQMGGRVGDVIAQTGNVNAALDNESNQVKTFVSDQTLQLKQDTQNKVNEANAALQQGLDQLSALRGQAAVGKQQQKADLFSQYQNQVSQIQAANQAAVNQLALWSHGVSSNLNSALALHTQQKPITQAVNTQPSSYSTSYTLPQQQGSTDAFTQQLYGGSTNNNQNNQQGAVPAYTG